MTDTARRNMSLGVAAVVVCAAALGGTLWLARRHAHPALHRASPDQTTDSYVTALADRDLASVRRLACTAQAPVVVGQSACLLQTLRPAKRVGPSEISHGTASARLRLDNSGGIDPTFSPPYAQVRLRRSGDSWCIASMDNTLKIRR